MAPNSTPSTPLRILTIDGGGLHAKSILLTLDELLNAIAKTNGLKRKPRPCDVFDVIAGTGTGGWLALLLGRFHMDVTACMSEWYSITQSTVTSSRARGWRARVIKNHAFDPDLLVEHINELTKTYGSGCYLYADDKKVVRTRHVFVAALRYDGMGYNLFRSYPIPTSAKLSDKLLEGPENPASFTISHAFGVTGAARYISPPWKEEMSRSGMVQYYDATSPNPHNITELALDEIWGLYGKDVEFSTVINIGPGSPSNREGEQSMKGLLWGLKLSPVNVPQKKRPSSPAASEERLPKKHSTDKMKNKKTRPSSKVLATRVNESIRQESSCFSLPIPPFQRISTFGSIKGRGFEEKQQRSEREIESDIQKKLANVSKQGSEIYYRLAPDIVAQGATKMEPLAASYTVDAVLKYLQLPEIMATINEIAQRMSEPPYSGKMSRAGDPWSWKESSVDEATLNGQSDVPSDGTQENLQINAPDTTQGNTQTKCSDPTLRPPKPKIITLTPASSVTDRSSRRGSSPQVETPTTFLSSACSGELPADARASGTYSCVKENCPAPEEDEDEDEVYTPAKRVSRRKMALSHHSWGFSLRV